MLSDDLDELEHQALDRLDDLDRSGEPDADDREAIERVLAAFDRLMIGEARRLLDAAEALADAEDAEPDHAIDRAALAEVRSALVERPSLAPALTSTLELLGLGLGLARDRLAWSLLITRCEATVAQAPESFTRLSTVLTALLRDAWPRPDAPPTSAALRVFRLQALGGAGPSIRTRALAAEHPEHAKLATSLLTARPDASPRELFDAFEAARAQLEAATIDEAPPAPEGPKRRFTWVHALLAAILLGLTLWHYLLR